MSGRIEITTVFVYKGTNVADLSHGQAIRALIAACEEIKALRQVIETARTAKAAPTPSLFESIFGGII